MRIRFAFGLICLFLQPGNRGNRGKPGKPGETGETGDRRDVFCYFASLWLVWPPL